MSRVEKIVPGTHKILWTSGWDSTFQLVRSLINHARPIQPFYLLDESRLSTAMELLAMKRIKQKIQTDLPARAHLLQPVVFAALSDLPVHEGAARAIAEIRKRKHIGIQYDWLARFCQQFGISDLQLCIHKDDRAHHVLEGVVGKDETCGGFRIDESYAGTPEYELFRHYTFPVFDLTKLQMEEIARDEGFSAIMALTWFCHAPKNNKPCGRCSPCLFTIDEGLGWRIPHVRRLTGRVLLNARKLARSGLTATASLRAR